MNLKPRRYLVTGGAGFVGSHLVDRLIAEGHAVTVLDNLSSGVRAQVHHAARFVEGDVRDTALLNELVDQAEGCFHLAAIASVQECNRSWANSHSVNLSAFVGLLEAVGKRREGVIPVVYASSAAIYGNAERFPITETSPARPISIYGADKAGCELHAKAAGAMKNVPSFGLRPFNIYGPRQIPSSPYAGVISIFAERLKRGDSLTIYGDGRQSRDFIHVQDIVSIFIAALPLAAANAPVCNAATGIETTILSVADHLATILNKQAKIIFSDARNGDIQRSVADLAQSRALLNDHVYIDIGEGLRFVLD